jgi:hypothetical protein
MAWPLRVMHSLCPHGMVKCMPLLPTSHGQLALLVVEEEVEQASSVVINADEHSAPKTLIIALDS